LGGKSDDVSAYVMSMLGQLADMAKAAGDAGLEARIRAIVGPPRSDDPAPTRPGTDRD
jgi:hypothetical protein